MDAWFATALVWAVWIGAAWFLLRRANEPDDPRPGRYDGPRKPQG